MKLKKTCTLSAAVCRNLGAKLRPLLLARIRIVSQEMMDWHLRVVVMDSSFELVT
jgi:hypothetical protein